MWRSVLRILLTTVMVAGLTHHAPAQSTESPLPVPGVFLVAARELRDPNFAETIVFLVDHDKDGSVGLVINRPTEAPLGKVFPESQVFAGMSDLLFIGGPVEGHRVLSLIDSDRDLPDSREIIDRVRLCWSLDVLTALVQGGNRPFRVYAGYSDWAPGQLDMEIARSDWRVISGGRSIIFGEPEGIWERLINRDSSVVVMGDRNRAAVP